MNWTEDQLAMTLAQNRAKRAKRLAKENQTWVISPIVDSAEPLIAKATNTRPVKMKEQPLQRQIMDYLDPMAPGLWYTKVPIGPMLVGNRHAKNPMTGFPDILVCAWGHFLVIEVKVPGKMHRKDQPKQDEVQAALKKAGATVIKADNLGTVRDIVEMMRSWENRP